MSTTVAPINRLRHTNGRNGNGKNGHTNGHAKPNGKPAGTGARNLQVERLVTRWESLKAEAKAAYEEIDRIEGELIASLTTADAVTLSDGRTAKIVDNFLDRHGQFRNVSYRPCGVRRFELQVK